MEDAAKEVPPPDVITEGGSDPVTRRCTYSELALVLAPGLDDAGCATLLKVGACARCCGMCLLELPAGSTV